MQQFISRRHRKLMDASEYALHSASASPSRREARIATAIVNDRDRYRLWELRHAELLQPVARQSNNRRLVVALRNAQVQLVHQRALFNYLRRNEIQGELRRKLFRLFHATLDYNDAVLAEHQQYMLAFSSGISADHIVDIMHDSNSTHLLSLYESLFARYFEMKCYVAMTRERNCVEMVRPMLDDVRAQLIRVRRRIESSPPVMNGVRFEREEALARSGRYKALNYLVV